MHDSRAVNQLASLRAVTEAEEEGSTQRVLLATARSERMERKLTTIIAMDVVGYSRLMEIDEQGTFDRLKDCLLYTSDAADE